MQEKKKSGPFCCGQNSRKLRFYRGVSYVALCLGMGGGLAGLELENSAQAAICFLPDCADKLEAFQGDANTSAQYCLDLGYVYYELGQCPPYYATEVCSGNDHYLKCDAAKWCEDNGYQLEVDDCVTPTYADEQCLNGLRFYKQCKVDYDKACHEEDADYVSECRDGWIFDNNELCSYSPLYGKCCNECADYPYEEDEIPQGYQKGESCQACGNVIKYKKELYDCAAEGFIRCDKGGQTGAEVCWSGSDKWYKECCAPCDDYPYLESQIPEGYVKGESCDSCDGMKYKLKSGECAAGYVWANNSCVICDETCSVGNILYSDMTCNSCNVSGKTPIGVVSYLDGRNGLAIQIEEPEKLAWASARDDIIGIKNYASCEDAKVDFNGKNNTVAWAEHYGDLVTSYAPGYCHNYTTNGTIKGQWYLPAVGELYNSIYVNQARVNEGLLRSGGTKLKSTDYLSTSEVKEMCIVRSSGYTTAAWFNGKLSAGDFRCTLSFEISGKEIVTVCGTEYKYSCDGENMIGGGGISCGGLYQSCQCASGYEWKNGACEQAVVCSVGNILNSDMTCSVSKVSGKTPIGVVSYISGSTRLAINLVHTSKEWGGYGTDISGLTNITSSSTAKNDFSGKSNTSKIVSVLGSSSTSYAAGYCYNYTTAGTSQGQWYLPAAGELYASIETNYSAVNNGIKAAGGTQLSSGYWYWSSSEYNSDYAWFVFANFSYVDWVNKDYTYVSYVRCVLAF